jgi:hypothetical protein
MRRRPLLTRRTALRGLVLGAASLPLVEAFGFGTVFGDEPRRDAATRTARARSVIEIWLWGGPAHLDTFDPKPKAGGDYCGPLYRELETNVPGIRVNAALPRLAQQADKYSLIRSMTHGQFGHETASYITQTGRDPGGRLVFPSIGAVVSRFRGYDEGYDGVVPPYVVMTTLQGRFSETGFLGPRYRPFVTGGDPNRARFAVEGIVAEGISDERQRNRRELLHELDTLGDALPDSPAFERLDACEEKAYEMILGDAGSVFDLREETDAERDRYGRNTLGQSCLVARRLVEKGVPYVKINSRGWDTHKQHFETMRRKLPELDRGVATLLADLQDRGLLDSTIVWCCGEFGRTPKVQWEAPWNGGRGHFGRCFSALVAGGGFRGGQVLGSTDETGSEVAERPVHPRELHGAIFTQLGIDPDGPLPNPRALDVRVTEPTAGTAGRLPELLA